MSIYRLLRTFFSLYLRMVHRLIIRGGERVPVTGPVIICANHTSYLDAMLVALCTPRQVRFLVSRDFFDHPLLGFFIRRGGGIPVNPSGSDTEALKSALRLLKLGEVIAVFPEGRLSRTGLPSAGRSGAVLMAALSGAVLVPVTIGGAFFIYPRGQKLPRPGGIRVMIHLPIPVDPGRRKEREYLRDVTDRLMAGIGKRIRGYYRVRGNRRRGTLQRRGVAMVTDLNAQTSEETI
jgi:1-acyl-sn-glycerol-3-phosphate acyltransferase